MKKALIGMLVVAVAVGFATVSFAGGNVVVKQKTVRNEGKTVKKIEAKNTATGAKVKVKKRVMAQGTTTTKEATAPGVKMKTHQKRTAKAVTGKTNVKIRHGALKDLSISYTYYKKGTEYIIKYYVRNKADPDLVRALKLTPNQLRYIKPGYHEIVSTSPYTAPEVRSDFRAVILRDLEQAAVAKK